jgi:hypothetical protein
MEGPGAAAVPYDTPAYDEIALRHERNIYLLLTLIPLAVSITINVIPVSSYVDKKPPVVALSLYRALILIPALGLMIYAVIRLGLFLEFTALEWVFAVLLVFFCSLLSVLYMLLKAGSPRGKPKEVGRIYEDEEARAGHAKGEKHSGRCKSKPEQG